MLCSCTQREPAMPEAPRHVELAALDTLMQSQPDSAFSLIYDFYTTRTDLAPFDRHYAVLLLAEALFKNDYEQSLRPEVQQAQTYFDSLAAAQPKSEDLFLLSARAHYMNGVGLVEADSVVEACAEYLKALEIMENCFDEKELVGQKAKFMALTYNRLGDLFSDQFMTEQAIVCFKKSLSIDRNNGPKYRFSKTLFSLGIQYNMIYKYDSALFYYNEALSNLSDTNNAVYRDILTNKALLIYHSDKKVYESLCILKHLRDQASDEEERLTRLFTIGNIYFYEKQYDSAIYYLTAVFEETTDDLRKLEAASCLSEIYNTKEDKVSAEKYNSLLAKHTMDKFEDNTVTSKLQVLFQQYQQQERDNKYAENKHAILKYSFLTIVILAITAMLFIITIRYKAKKRIAIQKKKAEAKQDEIQEKSRQIIENERLLHIEEKEKLEKEIAELKESLKATLYKLKHAKGSKKAYEDFLNEPVCCSIIEKIQDIPITTRLNHNDYININLEDETIAEYFEAVSRYFENFMPYLKGVDPNMEQEDVLICCLYLLGFEDKHIAFLRHKNFSSLNRRTNNLQKTFKTQRKFSDYIRKIAFEKYMAGK